MANVARWSSLGPAALLAVALSAACSGELSDAKEPNGGAGPSAGPRDARDGTTPGLRRLTVRAS